MTNRLGSHICLILLPSLTHTDTHTRPRFTRWQKCSLFTCQKHHQTMSYSAPLWVQWEVPGPTSPRTISRWACPTPTIVPHSTHTHIYKDHSRARGPTMQFRHTKTHTSPHPVRERKELQGWPEKNWGRMKRTEESQSIVCVCVVVERHSGPVIMVCVRTYHKSLIDY